MKKVTPFSIAIAFSIILASVMVVFSFIDSTATLTSSSLPKSKLQDYISSLPSEVFIEYGETRYATASSTLTSQNSMDRFLPKEKGLEIFYKVLFPISSPLPSNPFDQKLVELWVEQVAKDVETFAEEPQITYVKGAKPPYKIFEGKPGFSVNKKETVANIVGIFVEATSGAKLVVEPTGTVLTPDAIIESEKRAEKFQNAKITLQTKLYTKSLTAVDLFPLLTLPSGYSEKNLEKLLDEITKEVGTPPIEPELVVEGNSVKKFIAPADGIGVDSDENKKRIISQLQKIEGGEKTETVSLAVTKQSPKKTLANTNSLGIEERIGIGESEYAHSIPGRVHNVGLTTSRIHAKLVMPGEEFSFNKYLGEVSAKTGFKPAYIIKEGQTVLGDGGGVCQVSSTLFRAILNAGLPITERRGHSYRVSYYEQNSKPGFDATVYSPHPDLRFVNDTSAPILINAVANAKKTYMFIELYGKSDGRKAEIKNYKQWGAQPAPPPVYQDDPSLRPGQVKQVDYAAPGLKTSFEYVVTYPSGEEKAKTFTTNYIPWRAVYLRGPAQ